MSTAVELLPGAKLPEILTRLLPAKVATTAVERKLDLPETVIVTDKVANAVANLDLLSIGHQALTVQQRRQLAIQELDELSRERDSIDVLMKYLEARKKAMKPMVFNHFDDLIDVLAGRDPEAARPEVDDEGHYLTKTSVKVQGGARKFDRQLSVGAPFVTEAKLREAVDNVEGFSHEDYLACTTAVRAFDEEKTLIHMRKQPSVIEALRYAAQPGKTTSSFYHRPG